MRRKINIGPPAQARPARVLRTPALRTPVLQSLALGLVAALAAASSAWAQVAGAAPTRIIAFGDSLTAGYGVDADDAFPAQLERALQARGWSVDVVNAGVSGDTTAGGVARIDWSLADGGDLVIVALGANDGLRGLDPDQSGANLATIVQKIQAAGMRAMVAALPAPPNYGPDYQQRAERAFTQLVERFGVTLYPNFMAGIDSPRLLQADGLHPTPEGVARMVDGILPVVEAELSALGAQPATGGSGSGSGG